MNSEVGPVVVPNERDYAAAKDAEGGIKKRSAKSIAHERAEGGEQKNNHGRTRSNTERYRL